jgi:hypothetical protein
MQYLFTTIVFFFSYFLGTPDDTKKHSFIGVEPCSMCHKTETQGKQLDIWKNSKHALAYQVLTSTKADSIAKTKGFSTPASKTEACLKCHASGYNTNASLIGKKFKIEDGVQCETCHGPGSDYKAPAIMKNREESIKNGLIVHQDGEAYCKSCHNNESPTFQSFNYQEAWNLIKHPVPNKK